MDSSFAECVVWEEKRKVNIKIIEENATRCAVMSGDEVVIRDTQTALDLLMCVKYEADTKDIVMSKELVSDDFFVLSTGLAGEILQKFINYQVKIAIYGDFSQYTSKPLKDFIYECNRGRDIFFMATKEEAVQALAAFPD